MIAAWFHQFPLYVQYILALVMTDWLALQCWLAQRVLIQAGGNAHDDVRE